MHTSPFVLELGLTRKAAFSVPGDSLTYFSKILKNNALRLLAKLLRKQAEEIFLVCEDIVKNLVIRAKHIPLDFALPDPGQWPFCAGGAVEDSKHARILSCFPRY
jgi:hypothetical protein